MNLKATVIVLTLAALAGLTWLVLADPLGREATGLALGVVFGVLLVAPVLMILSAERPTRIEYRERIVYRLAEAVDDDEVTP